VVVVVVEVSLLPPLRSRHNIPPKFRDESHGYKVPFTYIKIFSKCFYLLFKKLKKEELNNTSYDSIVDELQLS
jgi:hypothetical protein